MMKYLAVLTILAIPAAAHGADGSVEAGSAVFKKCSACHSVEEPVNRVGPHLVNIIDRPAGAVPGYKYSGAMKEQAEKGLKWDATTLAAYLVSPKAMIPKTRMVFPGLKSEEEIADLIAFFQSQAGR